MNKIATIKIILIASFFLFGIFGLGKVSSAAILGNDWVEDLGHLEIINDTGVSSESGIGIAHWADKFIDATQWGKITLADFGNDGEAGLIFRSENDDSATDYRYALAYQPGILGRLVWQKYNWNGYEDDINTNTKTMASGEGPLHSLIYVASKNKLFALTAQQPSGKIIRWSDPKNLDSYDIFTFPDDDVHELGHDLVYDSKKDSIYAVFTNTNSVTPYVEISEIDPDANTWTYEGAVTHEIQDTSYTKARGVAVVGDDIFTVTHTSPANILKYSLSSYTRTGQNTITGAYGNNIIFDGTYLYAGTNVVVNQVDPSDLSTIAYGVSFGWGPQPQNLAYTDNYIYSCVEDDSGYVTKMDKSDMSETQISTGIRGDCYGIYNGGDGYIWVLFAINNPSLAPGKLARISLADNSVETYTFKTGEENPNEMVWINGNKYISYYMSPFKITISPNISATDTLSAIVNGTGTSTTMNVWKNTTQRMPTDKDNWDTDDDPADYIMIDVNEALASNPANEGKYVGIIVTKGSDDSPVIDDFYGGSLGSEGEDTAPPACPVNLRVE